MKMKWLGVVVIATLIGCTAIAQVDGQSSKPGSSKPPSSRPSTPPSSKPPPSSRPSTPPSTPPSSDTKPKYGPTPKTEPPKTNPPATSEKPKYGPSVTPPATAPPGNNSSKKPDVNSNNAKAEANKQQNSKRIYEDQQKATAPPKTEYKTADGRTVKVNPNDKTVEVIRSKPSSYYQPEVRQTRTVEHITVYHYHHDYNWYYGQPTIYIGGGYSSPFWYMMMEWDAERRARWLYNNQRNIEADAYNRGVQDAQVQAYIQRWQAEKRAQDPSYIDPEFSSDPSMMYTQDHIEAVYNPTVKHSDSAASAAAGTVLMWILIIFLGIAAVIGVIYLLTNVRFGK